jgi:hypothetical protein
VTAERLHPRSAEHGLWGAEPVQQKCLIWSGSAPVGPVGPFGIRFVDIESERSIPQIERESERTAAHYTR